MNHFPDDTPAANRFHRPFHRGWAVLLLAVVLLGVQSWLFGHQLDHLSSGSDEGTCEICLIAGGLSHAHPPCTLPISFSPAIGEAPVALPGTPRIARWFSVYQVRAPPAFG